MDYSHLELFHGLGRGGHRHDDTPVTVEVMGVNVRNRCTSSVSMVDIVVLLSCRLSGRLSEEVDQSSQKTLRPLGTKSSEIREKVGQSSPVSAMVKTLIASWFRSIADCGST